MQWVSCIWSPYSCGPCLRHDSPTVTAWRCIASRVDKGRAERSTLPWCSAMLTLHHGRTIIFLTLTPTQNSTGPLTTAMSPMEYRNNSNHDEDNILGPDPSTSSQIGLKTFLLEPVLENKSFHFWYVHIPLTISKTKKLES